MEKNQSGFTIIETLVAITLLGLISTLSIVVFNQLWGNASLFLKKEAFVYASQEIDRCINQKLYSDTVYTNTTGTLSINRKVEPDKEVNKIIVSVTPVKKSDKNIVGLSVYVKR